MTSSSSLYGSVNTQNTNSTNSTSLYGGADTPIPTPAGDLIVRGDLYVLSGNILTTATTGNIFPANATTINLGLAATTVNIGADTGTTTINNDLSVDGTGTFAGDITATGGNFGNIEIAILDDQTISTSSGELRLTSTSGAIKLPSVTSIYTDTTGSFNLLNQPTTVNAFVAATALNLGANTGTTNINNDLLIDGTNINIAPATTIGYSENNNRANRPQIQSTTGNGSGLRILAPNATTSASSALNLFGSNDIDNGSFLGIATSGSTTSPFSIRSGSYTAGVFGASGKSINIIDGVTTYATLNPAGPTIGSDLTTKTYVDAQISTGAVTSITGTTNQVIVSSPTGAVTLSLPQSIGTGNSPTFAGATLGNITVGVATDNTITTSTGDLTLDSATNLVVADANLTINGTSVNLAQNTGFLYNENNDRTNRPYVQSTSGNSSGFRVRAPNATTSATASLTVANTNDAANNTFLAIQALGNATDPLRIFTGKYTANVLGPSGTSVAFRDNVTTYATVNPSGPTISTDLTTKAYVDAIPNVTYTIDATTTTGGANFNLTGSDASVDTIKFASGTNVTVSRTDANTITIAATDTNTTYDFNATSTTGGANLNLVGSDSTTDTVKLTNGGHITATYSSGTAVTLGSDATDANTAGAIVARDGSGNFSASGATLGNVTVGVATDQTVTTSSGDLVLDSASGVISALGQIVSTRAGSATTGAGQIYLNGSTSNRIDWAATGTGAPAFTTRSDGTKAVLYPALGASAVDYALGVEAGALWSSIPGNDAGQFFKWYGGTTQVASLGGTGNFTANSVTANGATVGVSASQFSTVSGNATLNTANGTNSGSLVITAGANGAITLAPNGTGNVVNTFSNGGNLTNNRNYVFGAIRNSTTQNTNGDIWELNTSAAQSATNPYFRGVSLDNSADTTRGPMTLMRSYSGSSGANGSAQRGRVLFEKARGTAASPSAVQANDILGSVDVSGYSSTGWINDTIPVVPAFFGFAATENWVSNTNLGSNFTLTIAPSATTISTAANLIQCLNINPQTFTQRSDAFTWTNGKTGTTQTMALDVSGNLTVTGDVRINGNDIQGSGGASAITLTSANTATTVRGDTINLQTSASVGIVGNNISYNRVYGQWQYNTTVTPAASNTAYVFPIGTADFNNIATVGSTSHIIPGAAGMYKLQFSVQVENSDNGSEHTAYIWWRKNGTDVPASMGRVTVPKGGSTIAGWDNMISSANTTDYWELAYAVDDATHISFPFYASTAFGPSTAALFTTLVPIGA